MITFVDIINDYDDFSFSLWFIISYRIYRKEAVS